MNGLLLNVICAFTIANANPNIEKAQQTLDALYQNYAATNTCLLRENYPFDQDNKATYLASEEQAKDAMNIPTFGRIRVHSLQ